MLKIGYIGLGSLGAPIAERIGQCGFPLYIYDVVPDALDACTASGAVKMPSPVEVARQADLLCLCVRTDADVHDLTQDGQLYHALGEGGMILVQSTISPSLCETLAQEALAHGVHVMDCGVSGGAPAALAGSLSLYVGGVQEAVKAALPLLDVLGHHHHLGPVGQGMRGKLLNNLISIANYGLSSHILQLGQDLGFDTHQLHQLLMGGSAQSFALKVAPGFAAPDRIANMHDLFGKDVQLARSLAPPDVPAMQALVPAAQSMIDFLAARMEAQAALPSS